MKKFTKEFQLWTCSDYSYSPTEFATMEELLDSIALGCTSNFYITQKVDLDEIPTEPEVEE